jgi:hypothetical protein
MRAPWVAAAAALVALAAADLAAAQSAPPVTPPLTAPAPPSSEVGLGFVYTIGGRASMAEGDVSGSTDLTSAYGVELVATRPIVRHLSWLLAPRILLDFKDAFFGEGATQLDLRLGLRLGKPLAHDVHLHTYIVGGYSLVFPPDLGGPSYHPQGPLVAAGAGMGYAFRDGAMVTLSAGYQLGFQHATVGEFTTDYRDRFMDITVGILAALD